VSMVATPSALPIDFKSWLRPLNRNTELWAGTESRGNRERLSIRLSVIPSARYSVSGSWLELMNGRIAIDSLVLLRVVNNAKDAPIIKHNTATVRIEIR